VRRVRATDCDLSAWPAERDQHLVASADRGGRRMHATLRGGRPAGMTRSGRARLKSLGMSQAEMNRSARPVNDCGRARQAVSTSQEGEGELRDESAPGPMSRPHRKTQAEYLRSVLITVANPTIPPRRMVWFGGSWAATQCSRVDRQEGGRASGERRLAALVRLRPMSCWSATGDEPSIVGRIQRAGLGGRRRRRHCRVATGSIGRVEDREPGCGCHSAVAA